MIRDHTNVSGDVGPVVFDHLLTWWIIASGDLSERFPVRRSGFFDELQLFHIWLVDSKRFHRGVSRPEVVFRRDPWCAIWSVLTNWHTTFTCTNKVYKPVKVGDKSNMSSANRKILTQVIDR